MRKVVKVFAKQSAPPAASASPPFATNKSTEDPTSTVQPFDALRRSATVSEPSDLVEQEADRAADDVIGNRGLEQSSTAGLPLTAGEAAADSPLTREAGSQSPDTTTRAFMEARFRHDFSRVRIHTGASAAASADALNARAFTIGSDIVFGSGQYAPESDEGRRLIAHELAHVVQGQRAVPAPAHVLRDKRDQTPDGRSTAGELRAESLVAAKYPHLTTVLTAEHYKAIQAVIDWRLERRRLNQDIVDFDKRERDKAHREGMEGDSYRILSSYNDKLERLQSKGSPPPDVTRLEIDTSKLIDRKILAEPEWNIEAERAFRQSWALALSAKPTILNLFGDHPIEDVFRGVYWNGAALPTEGGLITWEKLLDIPGAFADYDKRVRHSPVVQAAEKNLNQLTSVHEQAESDYEFERERKGEFPIVSRVSEFFSSSIDFQAAAQYLPKGKSFDDMDPIEIMEFISSLDEKQRDRVSRVLPGESEINKVRQHLHNVSMAVATGKYEAALMTMPIVADEIQEMYRKVMSYRLRTLEGASTVVTGLQAVRVGCNIVLTIGGGVAGKAYGLIGISGGSALGAGVGTLSQETAMQLAEGHFDPGSILSKTGKDMATTFITSMIGGALGSRFSSLLGPRLAPIIPNQAVREFVIGRVADVGSGLITTPVEIAMTGMLAGEWPKNMDDLLDRIATSVVTDVIVGSGIDIVTGIPNLKGKEWNKLTGADVGAKGEVEAALDPAKAGEAAIKMAHAETDATPHADDLVIDWGDGSGPQKIAQLGPLDRNYISEKPTLLGPLDRANPLSSGGDPGSSAAKKGFGVFPQRVKTEMGQEFDAVVKVFPESKGAAVLAEAEAAKAAAASGLGPPYYGLIKIPAADKFPAGIGIVTGRKQAHFTSIAPTDQVKPGTPEWARAEAEAAAAQAAVSPQTIRDVQNYGAAVEKLGYATGGDLQGLVDQKGRWTPIDFGPGGLKELPADPLERLKTLNEHRKNIARAAAELEGILKSRSKPAARP